MSSRPEVEWDDTERDWMLALADLRAQEKSNRCHLCGLPKAICRSKDLADSVKVDLERCHVATAAARTHESYAKDGMPYMSAVDLIPQIENPAAGLLGPPPSQPSRSRSPLR